MRVVLIATLLLFALPGCQRGSTPPATSTVANAAAPAAPANPVSAEKPSGFFSMFTSKPEQAAPDLGDFKIVSVTLGNAVDAEQQVPVERSVFDKKDRIYAAVLSTGSHQGLKLAARWTTADGQLVAETEQPLVPTSPTVTTFSLRNGEPWPAGKYQLAISIDQQVQRTIPFEIR